MAPVVVIKEASLVKSAKVISVKFKSPATIVPLVISVVSMAVPKVVVRALPETVKPVPANSLIVSPPITKLPIKVRLPTLSKVEVAVEPK